MTESVRVATNNNFNCTDKEWLQLDGFRARFQDRAFFVNCNINTPALKSISDHGYKAVVTVNPDIRVGDVDRIYRRLGGIAGSIAFVRVKYVPGDPSIVDLIRGLVGSYKVVITLQRFNSLKSLLKYSDPSCYEYSCGRFRLHGGALSYVEGLVDNLCHDGYGIYICDRVGGGCQACGLCSELVTGERVRITSLNLSSSGVCPYRCPDCYARTMQNFLTKTGHIPIEYDVIQRNRKQAGYTAHIRHFRERVSNI